MLKILQEIETNGPATQLYRYNNLLFAFDGHQDLIEIDLKHQLLIRNKLKYPPLSVKCFNWEGANTYFIILLDKIEREGGIVVNQSNSKAEFTGPIDCFNDGLVFTKYHHNYKKYSINYLWEGSKKIIKLGDSPIKKIIFNPLNYQVIYSIKDYVNCLNLASPEKQTQLFKKSTFFYDTYNLYYLSLNLQNKTKEEYQCGIFDFRTGKHSDTWSSKEPPIKIQSFSRTLLVASANFLEFYDTRKLIKPFEREVIKGIKDFLYQPNINKLYIGCENKLRVYKTQY